MSSAIPSMMFGKRHTRLVWLMVSSMLVVGFVLSSCGPTAPAPEPEEAAETPAEEAVETQEATEEPAAETTEEMAAEVTEEATAEVTEEATAEVTEEATEEATAEATEEATEEAMAEATEEAAAASGDALPVGVILPFSGQYAWVGSNVLPVVQMVADEVNESGGIDGSEVVLVQGDTEGVVDAGTTAAQKLATVDGVLAFIGPTSLSFTGVRTTITDNGIPMVSPTAGTTELDQAGEEYFYRTVPSDSLGGRAIARAVASEEEYLDSAFSNVVVMVGQAPALISFKEPIESSLEEFGDGAAAAIEYKTEKQSYRTEVQEALAAEPDMIILVGTPEDSARIMQAAFEAGYEGSWFVTQDQTNAEFIELADPALVEGIYGLEEAPQEEAGERLEAFAEQVLAYSGEEVQIFGTNAYDAANILFLAMLRARLQDGEVTRENITENLDIVANPDEGDVEVTNFAEGKAALEAGQEINYQGLVGPANFDAYGNITAPFSIRQVQEGEWETIAVIQAEEL